MTEFESATLALQQQQLWAAIAIPLVAALVGLGQILVVLHGIRVMDRFNQDRARQAEAQRRQVEAQMEAQRGQAEAQRRQVEAQTEAQREQAEAHRRQIEAQTEAQDRQAEAQRRQAEAQRAESDQRHAEAMAALQVLIKGQDRQAEALLAAVKSMERQADALKVVIERTAPKG